MGYREDLDNPNLFSENPPGAYTYGSSAYGKSARGQLCISNEPSRDAQAQRTAGGEDRRGKDHPYGVDDGGHLIGARFGGATGQENLTPQDRNLNRSDYKALENSWAEHLEKGDKVFVNMESYTGDGSDRPTNYMGYVIIEHTDENGVTSRSVDFISLNNESRAEQNKWDEELDEFYRENPDYDDAYLEEDEQNATGKDQTQESREDPEHDNSNVKDSESTNQQDEDVDHSADGIDYGAEDTDYSVDDTDYTVEDEDYTVEDEDYTVEDTDYTVEDTDYSADSTVDNSASGQESGSDHDQGMD